jgi:hypothetical protein
MEGKSIKLVNFVKLTLLILRWVLHLVWLRGIHVVDGRPPALLCWFSHQKFRYGVGNSALWNLLNFSINSLLCTSHLGHLTATSCLMSWLQSLKLPCISPAFSAFLTSEQPSVRQAHPTYLALPCFTTPFMHIFGAPGLQHPVMTLGASHPNSVEGRVTMRQWDLFHE